MKAQSLHKYVKAAFNKRMLKLYWIGFMSGLPLMLTVTMLQAWLASEHINLIEIGLMTLVGLPYAYKFLWAPVLDKYYPTFLACTQRRKSWIIFCQLILALLIFSFSFISPQKHLFLIGLLALFIAFFSATQDIVIDAYRSEYLLPEERGMGSAAFIFSYRLATLISGGIGLILADLLGWNSYFIFMSAFMLLGAISSIYLPTVSEVRVTNFGFFDLFIKPFYIFLKQNKVFSIFLFIFMYKLGDAFTQSLGTTFFLRELHLSLSQVGLLYKTVGFISTILGAYLGGFLLTILGLYRSLFIFGLLQAFANLGFVALAHYGANLFLDILTITLDLAASGMATVALLTYFMKLCDIRYTASQFALLTAVMSIGRIGAGPFASIIVNHWGWAFMFFMGFFLSLPSLFFLKRLKPTFLH